MPRRNDLHRILIIGSGLPVPPAAQKAPSPTDQKQIATREARMAWWHEAKFGMFIHWGLYSIIGQHEWVKEHEGVPIPQYEILAKHHHPKPNAARDWFSAGGQVERKRRSG